MLETVSKIRQNSSKSSCLLHLLCLLRRIRRHLLRLWLRDPELEWNIPGGLTDRFSKVYDDVAAEKQVFPLEPRIRSSSDGVLNKNERKGVA